jgi:hypothetical protein
MIATDNIPVLFYWQPGYEPWFISKNYKYIKLDQQFKCRLSAYLKMM